MFDFHLQHPDRFVAAVRFTAQKHGFMELLVEKDYFCSIFLWQLFQLDDHGLCFKGGTLLNKVHAGFYRLSEDLDFSIDVKLDAPRSYRRLMSRRAQKTIAHAIESLNLKFSAPFVGYDESRGYSAEVQYRSLVADANRSLKVDVGVREPVLQAKRMKAQTLVADAITQHPIVPLFEVIGLSLQEAYSEKMRAALSRREPAVRDLFDIQHALQNKLVTDDMILHLTQHKLKSTNRVIDVSKEKKAALKAQMQTELRPVLRERDFNNFDFEQAWENICNFAKKI